jgi:hypothetical protein
MTLNSGGLDLDLGFSPPLFLAEFP